MSEDIVSHEDLFSIASKTAYQIGYKDIRSNKSFVLVRPGRNFSRGIVTLHKKDAVEQVVIDKELHDKLEKAAAEVAVKAQETLRKEEQTQNTKQRLTKKRKRTKTRAKTRKLGSSKQESVDENENQSFRGPRNKIRSVISGTNALSVRRSMEWSKGERHVHTHSRSASLSSTPPSENEDNSSVDNESDTDYNTDAEEELEFESTGISSDGGEDYIDVQRRHKKTDLPFIPWNSKMMAQKRRSSKKARSDGRAKKLRSESTLEAPETPQKFAPGTDHQFTSPLRKVIRDNLREYRNATASMQLSLTKNFVPTPLPTNIDKNYIERLQRNRQENDFFDNFEGYLSQRKMVKRADKPRSKNTMALAPEITREEFALVTNLFNENFQRRKREILFSIQRGMFPQYWFELTQGFSLLFYGIGSKRQFLEKFALEYLVPRLSIRRSKETRHEPVPCIIVNGYNPSCVYREVFRAVSKIMFPEEIYGDDSKFWGNLCMLQVQRMVEFYRTKPPDIKLVLLVHNIDGPGVRREMFQTLLSSLGVIRQIALIASADHIYAPVLWDNMKSQNYNFIFHNVTNYAPRVVESTFQDSMKLGKSDGISTSVDGVKYVLESLTKNSKRMYKLLLETQISNMDKMLKNGTNAGSGRRSIDARHGTMATGIDMKRLQQMCADEFIASNEMSLRTMLREFIEHKMAYTSRNTSGLDIVWVAYKYSDIQRLLSTVLDKIE